MDNVNYIFDNPFKELKKLKNKNCVRTRSILWGIPNKMVEILKLIGHLS